MKALADGLVEIVKGYVSQAVLAFAGRLDSLEQKLAALPTPKDGVDGKDGQDGKDAPPIDAEAVVAAVLALVPPPAAGKDGDPGKDGNDGKSFTIDDAKALIEPEIARWALDFERRAQDLLQRSIDRIPAPKDGVNGADGRDGVDALGFDNLQVEHDGERGFTIKFAAGDRVKEFSFVVPVVLDRGYYREGDAFEKGDGVTFGGSYWIAQATTRSKPEIGNAEWRLAVKKGRDAKTPANLEPAK
ncbi:integrin beta 3 [Variovorax boronicumulans]|uniref:hypothetical protein n=1 Tax=Variovorax boronicumulans TaxID=436515 RepID=UPI002783A6AA|nr:hypothetical protein [Variovorax boronicumulans]MDQ0035925.1 integrin beta 3 [Variovorax boronicumulans]